MKTPFLATTVALFLATPAVALDLSGRDAAVGACTDFYDHVNGAWQARAELPPDRARIGSFDQLRIANDRLLERALTELIAEPARQSSPGLKLLAAAYRSAMDEAAIEKAGLKAVQPLWQRIDGLRHADDLPALLGELARHRIAAPLSMGIGPDAKDVRRHTVTLAQGGLGLPDRDDYMRADDESRRLSAAYRKHAARLLELAGVAHDAAALDALLAFEARLAQASMTQVERRNPQATYHRFSAAELTARAPGLDWAAALAAYLGPEHQRRAAREFVVGQPAFMQAVAALAREASLADWQRYLRVRLLDRLASRLPSAYARSHFEYHETALRGVKSAPPRAERAILELGGATGGEPLAQALGELYVAKAFSPLAQQRANAMVEDIRQAMRERIRGLAWMSEPTKQRALAKLDAMALQIGAPTQWPDYSALRLRDDDHAGNALRLAAWDTAERAADLDRPVDRRRWTTSPHIVNAFAGGLNRIVFPAGILQPPFFDEKADDAANFGGIGMVIGHEITHHFDDRGRQFDAVGNLSDWLSAEDAAAYRARADRVVALYASYEPLPGVFINGRQMLGENISDLGGIRIAFDGLKIALARQRAAGKTQEPIDGLTPEQRFFTANAVVWRNKQRDEALLNQLRTGQHSPGRFRVRGPMSNMPAFAQAFGCRADDSMVAPEPVAVW